MLVLPQRLIFEPEHDDAFFGEVPAKPAVFLLRGESGEPYASKSSNLRRRVQRLLGESEGISRRLNLRERAKVLEYALTGSDFESGLLLYKVLRKEFPKTYGDRLRLRMAPMVRFHLENRYPRVSVTTKLGSAKSGSVYYGPFPSRVAAEKFANDALDFFKIRRCTDDLAPDPAFPGCIYSEMKMCLAPCFRGCTDQAYRDEVARVEAFFDSRGESLRRELSEERDRTSADLEFETAAAAHAQLEKLAPVLQPLPEIVTRVDRLRAVIVQPSALAEHVALFVVEGGIIAGPVQFPLQLKSAEQTHRPQSMESRVQQALADLLPHATRVGESGPSAEVVRITTAIAGEPCSPDSSERGTGKTELPPVIGETRAASSHDIMEQLAYLRRWYYRSSKTGEIFFADAQGDLPWRRIVRGISRVFRGEKPAGDVDETTRDYWINRGRAAELNPDNYNV